MKGNLLPVSSDVQAYWLGFITADGHVSKSGYYVSIQLARKDRELLELFASHTGATLSDGAALDSRTGKTYTWSRVMLYSVELNSALKSIGLSNDKTQSLNGKILESIPTNLLGAFFRGFFDGDGHIGNIKGSEYRLTLVGSYDFLKALNLKVSASSGVRPGSIYKSGSIWALSYTGAERIVALREWMQGDGPWLTRKKQVWQQVELIGSSKHKYIYLMKDGRWWARWRDPKTKKYMHFGRFATEEEAFKAQQAGLAEFSRGL